MGRDKRRLILSISVLAVLLAIALAIAALRSHAQPHYITLMTFNTHWLFDQMDDPTVLMDQDHMPDDLDAKLAGIAEVMRRHSPDVVALQEVENRAVLDRLTSEYLADLGYAVYWFDSLDRATGQDVAVLTRLETVGVIQDHLKATTILQGETWRLSKGLLDIKLQIPGSVDVLHVYTTHLKSQLPIQVDGERDAYLADCQRAGQGKLVRELTRPALDANEYVVVMGDFNDDRNSPALEFIIGDNGPGRKLHDALVHLDRPARQHLLPAD